MNGMKLGPARKTMPEGVIGWYPCAQANTDTTVYDRSGNGNDLTKGAAATWDADGSTGIWETAYHARTRYNTGDTDDFRLILANAAFSEWDSTNGDSLVVAWRGSIATPAAQVPIFGNSYLTTAGIRIRVTAAQKMQVSAYSGSGGPAAVTLAGTDNVAGGTERHHLVAIDGQTGRCTYYINGTADATLNNLGLFTPGLDLRAPSLAFGIGGAMESSSNVGSILCDFSEILILRRANRGLPSNMATIARMMTLNPYLYVTTEMGW
jgi:hypothetical protein